MGSTAFETLVLPVSLSSLLAFSACWLASAIVGWSRRLILREPKGMDGWEDSAVTERDTAWRLTDFEESRLDPS